MKEKKQSARGQEDSVIQQAEEFRKLEKKNLHEALTIAQADEILLRRQRDFLQDALLVTREKAVLDFEVQKGHIKMALINATCLICGAKNPSFALPWAVMMQKIVREGTVDPQILTTLSNGCPFSQKVGVISVDELAKNFICTGCKTDVEEFIGGLPTAKLHEGNKKLHPRESVVRFWQNLHLQHLEMIVSEPARSISDKISELEKKIFQAQEKARRFKTQAAKDENEAERIAASQKARKEKVRATFAALM